MALQSSASGSRCRGITQINLLSQIHVGYEDIIGLQASEGYYSLETKDGHRPIHWSTSIADTDELREELETHTGLRFIRSEFVQASVHQKKSEGCLTELVEKVQNPAEEPNDVQQQLKGGYTGR